MFQNENSRHHSLTVDQSTLPLIAIGYTSPCWTFSDLDYRKLDVVQTLIWITNRPYCFEQDSCTQMLHMLRVKYDSTDNYMKPSLNATMSNLLSRDSWNYRTVDEIRGEILLCRPRLLFENICSQLSCCNRGLTFHAAIKSQQLLCSR